MRALPLVLALVVAAPALAQAGAAAPKLTNFVVDDAHVLDAPSTAHIRQVARQLDDAGIAQLVVATVTPEMLGDEAIEQYAVDLGQKSGVGHGKKREDGLIVLFVPGPPGHRKIYIATGYDLEGPLPDGKVGELRTEQAFPYMRNNDYSGAAVHVVDAAAAILQADAAANGGAPRKAVARPAPSAGGVMIAILCMLALLGALIAHALRRRFPGSKSKIFAAVLTAVALLGVISAGGGGGFIALAIGLVVNAVAWASIRSHKCPRDGGWMTIDEQVIDPPTYWSHGVAHVTQRCTNAACGYLNEFDKQLPRKQRTVYVSGGGGGGFSGGGGGSDSGGFSGGGGGFGGGGAGGEV